MTTPLPPDPPNWTTRPVGKDEQLQCDRCLKRIRPGRTAYVADHTDDEFPEVAVYCSVACRHFAERPDTTYLRDDGAALAAAREQAGDGYIHDLDDACAVQGHVTVLAQELPRLRERIAALRAQADAEGIHPDLAAVYRKDADNLQAVADACDAGHYLIAARHVDRLDTAVRDELGQRLYDAIRALAAGRHEMVAYSGDAAEVLRDVLKDNLSPQAVAALANAVEDYLARRDDPASPLDQSMDPDVVGQLRWLAGEMIAALGGAEAYHEALRDAAV